MIRQRKIKMAEVLPQFSLRAGDNLIHMEIIPTEQEAQRPSASRKRARSTSIDSSATEGGEESDGDKENKRRRKYYELDMPLTDPVPGESLHDPELYAQIQRVAKGAGSYVGVGANVVVRYHPYVERTPTPPESFMRPWSYGILRQGEGDEDGDIEVDDDEESASEFCPF